MLLHLLLVLLSVVLLLQSIRAQCICSYCDAGRSRLSCQGYTERYAGPVTYAQYCASSTAAVQGGQYMGSGPRRAIARCPRTNNVRIRFFERTATQYGEYRYCVCPRSLTASNGRSFRGQVGSTCRPTVYPRRFCNDIFRVRSTATCRDWRNTACNPPRTGRRLLSNLSYAENVLKSGPDHPEDTEEAKEAKTDVVDAFEENLFSASAIDH